MRSGVQTGLIVAHATNSRCSKMAGLRRRWMGPASAPRQLGYAIAWIILFSVTLTVGAAAQQVKGPPLVDETSLSINEQNRRNVRSELFIAFQSGGLAATVVLGLPFVPPQVSIPAEIYGLGIDNSLKWTKAVLQPEPDIYKSSIDYTPDPGTGDLCTYQFDLPRTTATYFNMFGVWPVYGGDALYNPNDMPFDFGELGTPRVFHVNTDVELKLDSLTPGLIQQQETPQTVIAGAGNHIFEWRADSIWNPMWDFTVPALMIPLTLAVEMKFAEFIKPLKTAKKVSKADFRKLAKQVARKKLKGQRLEPGEKAKLVRQFAKLKLDAAVLKKVNKQYKKTMKRLNRSLDKVEDFSRDSEITTTSDMVDAFFFGFPAVSRKRHQRLTVYDIYPPTVSTTHGVDDLTFEAIDAGGLDTSRPTWLSRVGPDLVSVPKPVSFVDTTEKCGRTVTLTHDMPKLLPIGDTLVTWTVRDQGPAPFGIDHDDDGDVDTQTFFSRTITQIVTIEDTQGPILVPPPSLVIESTSDQDLDTLFLGKPLVVDLGDFYPTVIPSHLDNSGACASQSPSCVAVGTRTRVKWSASDDAVLPNVSEAYQLVTVKSSNPMDPSYNKPPNQPMAPTEATLISQPVDIVLTGSDPDALPITGTTTPLIPDPLTFHIESPPTNGRFVAPLLPYFIDDYRTDQAGALIDYINANEPDPPPATTLRDTYVAAIQNGQLEQWIEDEFCTSGSPPAAPVDFVYDPLYIRVTDNGDQYIFDHYLECDPLGLDSPPFNVSSAVRPRISHWDAAGDFLAHARIDDNGGSGIPSEKAVFRIDAEGFIYYVDSMNGGAPSLLIQRCGPTDFTAPPNPSQFCLVGGFGPIDNGDTSSGAPPENALVDLDQGLVYVTAGTRVELFDHRLEEPENPLNPTRLKVWVGTLSADSGANPEDFLHDLSCAVTQTTSFDDTMELDSERNLYVTDNVCNRIHKFEPSYFDGAGGLVVGRYIGWMGKCDGSNNQACEGGITKGYTCTVAAACTIPAIVPPATEPDSDGSNAGQFSNPAFLAIDPNDILYVADYGNSRIQRFGPDGTFAGQARSTGMGISAPSQGSFVLGNMGPPKHVSVNSENFFVVDQTEDFIHIFTTSPFKDVSDSSATVTYVSDFDFSPLTSDSFSFSVHDGLASSVSTVVGVNVSRNYRQPEPEAQSLSLDEDDQIEIVLRASDPDGLAGPGGDVYGLDTITFEVTQPPSFGELAPVAGPFEPGTEVWTYTPDADYHGTDSFTFAARDACTNTIGQCLGLMGEELGYGDAEADITLTVNPINDAPIVFVTPPERIGAGFSLQLTGSASDDPGTAFDASVFWGDGSSDGNGELIFDDNDTPLNLDDDTVTLTGVLFSSDGLEDSGLTPINAHHVYDTIGAKTIRLCMRDSNWLESCDEVNVLVESLVSMGVGLGVDASEPFDGIAFAATIDITNEVPLGSATPLDANDVVLEMDIPASLLASNATPSQGSCSITAGVLHCDLGTMINGSVATVDLDLRGVGTLVYDESVFLNATVGTSSQAVSAPVTSVVSVDLKALGLDRDANGLDDTFEALYGVTSATGDADLDGIDNQTEQSIGTSPVSADSDQDGIDDAAEIAAGTDPTLDDSDGDGISDGDEVNLYLTDPLVEDSDADGMPDGYEVANGFDPLDNSDGDDDTDGDGLTDLEEFLNGSDYQLADSDGDTLSDGDEVHVYGTDPNEMDSDDDGMPDDLELLVGTDPLKPDTDGDGLHDGRESAIGFFGPQKTISTGANGARSVAVADVDGDGDIDVLSASRDDDTIAWYENLDGKGAFGPEQLISINSNGAFSVFAADLDDDGDVDVISGSAISDRTSWHENLDGAGQYWTEHILATNTNQVRSVFAADLDGDGDVEVLAASQLDDRVVWFENLGSGSFGPKQIISSSVNGARSVHAADLDGDGDADVLSAALNGNRIYWHENSDGLGSFNPQQVIAIVAGATSAVAADLDGDGDADVASSSFDDDEIRWWRNTDGNGNFVLGQLVTSAANGARSVVATDVDGDGDIDLLSASDNDSKIAWYENTDGLGSFGPQQVITTATNAAYSVAAADLDGDGDIDTLSASSGDDRIAWYEQVVPVLDFDSDDDGMPDGYEVANGFDPLVADAGTDPDGDGTPTAQELLDGTNPLDADTDRDGLSDSLELAQGTDPLNRDTDGDGLLDGQEIALGTNPLSADSDGDGLLDAWEIEHGLLPLVADALIDSDLDGLVNLTEQAAGTDPNVADSDRDGLLDGDELATGNFGTQQVVTTLADQARSVFAADVDGDGDVDTLSASAADDTIAWYENIDGLGSYGPRQVISILADMAWTVSAADIDGDGDVDALSASEADDKIAWYENTDGLGSFGPQQVISTQGDGARYLVTADVDGDGDLDVLAASRLDDELAWYENTDGLGSFGPQQIISTLAVGVSFVQVADMDGDGDIDALSASDGDNKLAWYENLDGLGSFGPQQIISTSADGVYSASAADVDGDGDLDVMSASVADDEIAWYENTNGLGAFGPQQIISTLADGARSIFAADVDGDGDIDAISASELDDEIAWYENLDGLGGFSSQKTISALADMASVVIAADVDGDGDQDVLSASAADDKIAWYEHLNLADPLEVDSDDDGMNDGWEQLMGFDPFDAADGQLDSDADGALNFQEYEAGTDPFDMDSDDDGLLDGAEITAGLDPLVDADLDGDGLSDADELNTYSTEAILADSDRDGLDDGAEILTFLTDPNVADSDGDGLNDGLEIAQGSDPNDANSPPTANVPGLFPGALAVLVTLLILSGLFVQRSFPGPGHRSS